MSVQELCCGEVTSQSLRQTNEVWRLTNGVQIQAVGVVADDAFQERIAVLGSAKACTHYPSCTPDECSARMMTRECHAPHQISLDRRG